MQLVVERHVLQVLHDSPVHVSVVDSWVTRNWALGREVGVQEDSDVDELLFIAALRFFDVSGL